MRGLRLHILVQVFENLGRLLFLSLACTSGRPLHRLLSGLAFFFFGSLRGIDRLHSGHLVLLSLVFPLVEETGEDRYLRQERIARVVEYCH